MTQPTPKTDPDFILEDHGSLYIFQPMNGVALEWAQANVEIPDYMWIAGGFACEHSCAAALYQGITNEGFTVSN